MYLSKFLSSSEINLEIEPYLDLGIYYLDFGFLSSEFLSSTEAAIMSHLVSMSANFPLKMGEPAVKAKNIGDKIDN